MPKILPKHGSEHDGEIVLTPTQQKAELARRLNNLLKEKRWSQSDLAREAARFTNNKTFGRFNVSEYSRAKALPGPVYLAAMAQALGVEETELLPVRVRKSKAPPMDVRNLGNGRAYLKIEQEVPWDVAMKILALVNENIEE